MSRTDWVLGFALLVVLAVVAFFGVFFWQQSRLDLAVTPNLETAAVAPSNSVSVSNVAGRTAIVAFGAAQSVTSTWHNDAMLVSAKATWSPNLTAEALKTGVESWSFTFYSPAAGEAANVLVTQSKATIGDSYEVDRELSPMLVSGWKINSDEAIQIFMDAGGAELFATEQDVLLTMQLSTVTESGKMEWIIAAISDRSGRGLSAVIDATSGEVLEVFRES